MCIVTVFTMLAYILLFPYCCMYIITSMHDLDHLKHICALLSAKVCIYSLFFVSSTYFLGSPHAAPAPMIPRAPPALMTCPAYMPACLPAYIPVSLPA